MIRLRQVKVRVSLDSDDLVVDLCAKKIGVKKNDILSYKIIKRSIDARDKDNIYYSYIVDLEVLDEEYILISINSKYLLPSYIMNLIEDKDPDKINGTSHIYNIDDIEYEIKSNQESIYEITITENNIISKLEYSVLNWKYDKIK